MQSSSSRHSPVIGYVLVALAGILLGLGAGYLTCRSKIAPCPRKNEGDSTAGQDSSHQGGRPDTGDTPGSRLQGADGRSLAALYRSAQARANYLAQENERLKKILHYYREDQKATQGSRVRWPHQVKQRYRKDALRKAVESAFKEAGLDGNVTDVDCEEYPCVVAAELNGPMEPGIFMKLKSTQAMSPYLKDSGMFSTSPSRRQTLPDGTKKESYFIALSFLEPAWGGAGSEVQKRTAYRLKLLFDALVEP